MAGVSDRETGEPPLGVCPDCGAWIPPADLVVKYETPDEWPRMLAECTACEAVVSPE